MWTIVRFTLSRTRTHGHKPIYGPDGPDGPDLQVAGLVCKLCQVFDTVVTVAISVATYIAMCHHTYMALRCTEATVTTEGKQMIIGTKAQAKKLQVESLFKPVNGRTLSVSRWDMGAYNNNLRGREIEVPAHVSALWTEKRKDKDGEYFALFCLTSQA